MQISPALLELTKAKTDADRTAILKNLRGDKNSDEVMVSLFLELLKYADNIRDAWDKTTDVATKYASMIFGSSSENISKLFHDMQRQRAIRNLRTDFSMIDLFAGMECQTPASPEHNESEEKTSDDSAALKNPDDRSNDNKAPLRRKGRISGSKNKLDLENLQNNPNLTVVDEYDDVSVSDSVCPVCGTEMKVLGDEIYSSELRLKVSVELVNHHHYVYKCPNHEYHNEETPEIVRPVLQSTKLISHSFCSNQMLSMIIWNKCAMSLPLYRQEKFFQDVADLQISCKRMSEWIITADKRAFQPVRDRLLYWLKKQEFIHADETPILVFREPGKDNQSKSYYWVLSSSKWEERRIVIFTYYPSRSGSCADNLLAGYDGVIETDKYSGYNKFLRRLLCWTHMVRDFKNCVITRALKYTDTELKQLFNVLSIAGVIFAIEKDCRHVTFDDRLKVRQVISKPLVDEFFRYLHELASNGSVLPKSRFGEAINYALTGEEHFRLFLTNGKYDICNNTVENCIRIVTVGRKNWLFSGSPDGAAALANCYSLIETAEQNGLNGQKYLEYIANRIDKIPGYARNPEKLDVLMPWNPDVVAYCRKKSAAPASQEEQSVPAKPETDAGKSLPESTTPASEKAQPTGSVFDKISKSVKDAVSRISFWGKSRTA